MYRSLARTPKPRDTWPRAARTTAIAIAFAFAIASCASDTAPVADPPTTLGADSPPVTPPTSADTPTSGATTGPPPTDAPGASTTTAPPPESTTTAPETTASGPTARETTASGPTASVDTEPPVPTEPSAALTTAGSFGVTVGVPLGSESLILTEPMQIAVTASDGRIFMQRGTAYTGDDVDPTPLVTVGNASEFVPIELPGAAEGTAEDTVVVHDVATVDGEVTLLYETVPADCSNPQACVGALMTFQPDTGASVELASRIVFEGGWSGLEIADNGLVVGTESESIARGIFLASITDTPVPSPTDLGLEEFYGDCNVCPFGYTIDPTGRFIGWVDRGEGVDFETPAANQMSNEIAVVDISDAGAFSQQRLVLDVSAAFGELDIADIAFGDDGFANGQAMFQNGGSDADGNPLEPVKVDLRDGRIGGINAVFASLNPNPAET